MYYHLLRIPHLHHYNQFVDKWLELLSNYLNNELVCLRSLHQPLHYTSMGDHLFGYS